MSERTPGPWKWHWRTNENGKPECGIFAEPRDGHAYSVARCPQYQSRKKWEADAAFIVKACNAHEQLVGALQGALVAMTLAAAFPGVKREYDFGPACAEVVAALKAAGTEP